MKTRRSKASRSRRFADRQAPENRALAFEILERRLVLDLNYFWVGGGAGDEWADLANWELSNGSAPTTPTDSTDATYFDTGPDPAGIKDVSISGAANNDYAAGSVDVHGSGTAQFFLMGHVLNVGPDPSGNKYAFRVQADNDDETGAAPSAVIDDSFARAGLLNAAGIIVGGNSEASLSVNSARVTSTTLSVGSTSDLYDQPGQVTLDNGADAEMTGNVDIALGTVKVDGSSLLGAANIYVGERQAALLNAEELSELDVLPGSRVASDGVVLIGGKANVKQGYGLVHLYGGGAALDSGKVTSVGVGTEGTGQFDIDAGSVARTAGFVLGSGVGSEGTATVAGIWSSRSHDVATENQFVMVDSDYSLQIPPGVIYRDAAIAAQGDGTLTIVPDGQVEVGNLQISPNAQTTGNVNINGAGAKLIALGDLAVGGFGNATLTLSGGLLSTQGLSTISGPQALVKIVNGGVWYAGQPGNKKDIQVFGANGQLHLDNGTIYANQVDVQAGGTLSGDGTIEGDAVENGGTIRPGINGGLDVIGKLTINGNFNATGGVYAAEIAGPGDNDQLAVSNTATLGGSMIVPAIGSPDFEPGQTYTMLTASNVVGQFSNLPAAYDPPSGTYVGDFQNDPDLPALPSGLEWEVQYTPTAVKLSVVPMVSIESNGGIYETDTLPGSFTVMRTGPTTTSLTVSYTASGSAVSGTDYAALSGSVTIPSGSRTANIYVSPEDDGDVDESQSSETLTLTLVRQIGSYALGTPQSADMTIGEDPPPTVSITASAPNAVEVGSPGAFTVSRTGPIDDALYVNLSSSGTAVAGTNYQGLPSGVLIMPGARSAALAVNALDDGTPGAGDPETVTETVEPGSGYYVGAPSSANVAIQEEGYTTVTIAATTPSTYEGSMFPAEFTVTRQAPYTQALVVNYSLSGSAISGTDYQPLSGSVTIAAGSPTATIDVTPLDDGDGDDGGAGETLTATLAPAATYQVGSPSEAAVTLGEEPPLITMTVSQPDISEQSTQGAVFTLTRTGPTTSAVTVGVNLAGTAQKGVDYVDPGPTVTIPAGQSSASFTIVPIDDGDGDDNLTSEWLTASVGTLPGGSGLVFGSPHSATLTIVEDSPPTVAVAAVVSSTFEDSPDPAEFVVSRSGPTTSPLTVNYQTEGNATGGTDYVAIPSQVTIPAGRASAEIDIDPLDDESQSDESSGVSTAIVQLSPGGGYQLSSQNSASVQIDEEPLPEVDIYGFAPAVEAGAHGDFLVMRESAFPGWLSQPLTVLYTMGGTAVPGQDYQSLAGSVTIPAGSTEAMIDVSALEDSMEGNSQPEIVTLTLGNGTGHYAIGTSPQASIEILEQPVPTVTVAAGPDVTEGGAPSQFTVTRTAPFDSALTVQYTVSGSAVAGSDYQSLSGTVTIAAGAPSAVIDVAPLDDGAGDDTAGAPETIVVQLAAGSGYLVGMPYQAQMNLDEEPPPTVTISAAADATEGGDTGEFSVARTGITGDPLTVNYTVGGSAAAGSDYTALSGTVTIPAGTSTAVITVAPLDDGDEDDANPPAQTVVATLASSANYAIGQQASATVNIGEEPLPVVTIADTGDTIEGGDPGQFTVSRTGPIDDPLTVSFAVAGTAVPGADYSSIGTSVTIPAGQSSATIAVSPLDDLNDDNLASEDVAVTLTASSAYTIGAESSAAVTIAEEPPPVVSIFATTPQTDELGSTPGEFTVFRSGPTDGALTVSYTLSGAAVNGTDYQTLSGTVTIADGSNSATIDVTPLDDGADDPSVASKDVVATLSASAAYALDSMALSDTVTIVEDPVVTIAATTPSTAEGGSTPGEFTVTRTGSTDFPLLVSYTLGGTAINNTDYQGLSGTVLIPIGAATATIDVNPNDDLTDDANVSETVTAALSAGSGYDLGAPNSDTVTIYEEPTVTIAATTPTTAEDDGTTGVFTISRTGPTTLPLTVNFSLGGSAVAGTDYSSVPTTVTIAAGQSSTAVAISPIDDLNDDANASESVVATLTSGGYEIGAPSTATVTIDEEPPPTVTIAASTPTTQELSSSPGVFTVSRTGPTDGDLAVNYTLGGTAINGTDYSSLSGTVTIPNGSASVTLNVSPLDDLNDDSNASETAIATLASSSGYIVGTQNSATVTIDEEPPPVVTIAATTANTAELSGSPGVFTVTRAGPLDGNLVVNYTMGGSATNGTDYATLAGSVTIPDGQASVTFNVAPLDDGDGDDSSASATATATLAAGTGYTVGSTNQATVTIYEEPTVVIAATTANTNEYGAAPGVFTVTRTGLTTNALTVDYTLAGTALAGTDFQNPGGSVTIPAGQASASFNIAPIDDGDGDDALASEDVVATLSASSAYNVGSPNQATVTIAEEAPPVVSIVANTATILETGSTLGVFTVSRTGPTDDLLTVNLTFGGTATPGTDYDALGSTFTFGVGESSVALDVTPLDDGGDDTTLSQSVTATVAAGTGYTAGDPDVATVTIDEDYIPTVTIAATTANVGETSGGSGVFTVSFSGPAPNDITVDYGVSGSAVSNTDYQGLSGSVIVPAGQTSATIDVTPLDDGDGDESASSATVTATLQSATAYVIGSPNTATVTISEDNSPPPPPTPTTARQSTEPTTKI